LPEPRSGTIKEVALRIAVAAALAFVALPLPAARASAKTQAQPSDERKAYNEARYLREEVRIPMRDGVRLFTVIYRPKDEPGLFPILLRRTPYGAARGVRGAGVPASLGPGESAVFAREGFIFVDQDVRGRFQSGGSFEEMRPLLPDPLPANGTDESTDAYDTIEWLLAQVPDHNGRVATYGISYMGTYAACALVRPHPSLKAAILQAPAADFANGDDFRRNGAFYLSHAFNWMNRAVRRQATPTNDWPEHFDPGTRDGYDWYLRMGTLRRIGEVGKMEGTFSWQALLDHPNYDAYWRAKALAPHLTRVDVPVLVIGGWFDAEDFSGTLAVFHALSTRSDSKVRLALGPWTHGDCLGGNGRGDELGGLIFGDGLVSDLQEKVELPFLAEHLKGAGLDQNHGARVFEVGTNRWRDFSAWPPPGTQAKALYLAPRGALASQPPRERRAVDSYVSDPARPVPYLGRVVELGYAPSFPVADQRSEARRPDVLVYATEPLAQNLTLAGGVDVDLWASTSGSDSDWVAKLIDVWPNDARDQEPNPWGLTFSAYQQLVRGEVMRGKYRNSLENPEPMQPSVPTRIRYRLPDVCHTFRVGHRIMIHIQSSWFPLIDRNPQVFMDIGQAQDEDFKSATQRIYRDATRPSRIVLPVLP
jgi:hypothetical protein